MLVFDIVFWTYSTRKRSWSSSEESHEAGHVGFLWMIYIILPGELFGEKGATAHRMSPQSVFVRARIENIFEDYKHTSGEERIFIPESSTLARQRAYS